MRLWVLGSGSRGNAVLLESGSRRLLVDAGFGVRTLAERLAGIGVAPASIATCVITHEHADHVKGAAQAAARWGWRLHATAGTIAGCPALLTAETTTFAAGDVLDLDGFTVATARTPHDAQESVALTVTATSTGARAGICYDLGHAPEGVRALLHDLDLLVLEANHDAGMLRAGPYPPSVASRIAGRWGHLSNDAAATLARDVAAPALRHVVLAHLSESCNEPRLAADAVHGALARTRFRGAVTPAPQDAVVGPFALAAPPRRAAPARAAEQLALGL